MVVGPDSNGLERAWVGTVSLMLSEILVLYCRMVISRTHLRETFGVTVKGDKVYLALHWSLEGIY